MYGTKVLSISNSINQLRRTLPGRQPTTTIYAPQRMHTSALGMNPSRNRKMNSNDRFYHSGPAYTPVSISALSDAEAASSPPSHPQPSSLLPVFLWVAAAGMGALSFGYHLGVVNGPLQAIAADLGFASDAALEGAVVSSLLAGAAIGSLAGSGLADSFGRKKALLLDVIPTLAGSLLCAWATSLTTILAGRLLAGLGIGLSSALVPLYISEIAPTALRGTLGSVNQLLICIGILAALVVNVALPSTAWRTMFALAAVPPVLMGLGMLMAPESPTWLVLTGKRGEAEVAATKLWGQGGTAQLPEPSSPSGGEREKGEGGWGETLASKGARVGIALFLLQQFSGINAIVYFSSSVFSQAGVKSGALASAAVGALNVAGTIVAAGLMDKAGRKQLLELSFTGMGISMLAMAFGLGIPALSSFAGSIALLGTLGYIASFAIGAGPVPGLLVPEITASKVRGRAVSAAMGTHWVCNFVIGQVFLGAVRAFGVPAVYGFFSLVCAAAVVFSKNFVVETKGRSLEEVERAMAAA
jgi:sugar porter (SP) family MFS transporter